MAIIFTLVIMVGIVVFSGSAEAYIGPSLGIGTIGMLVGFIISIFLSLFAILWYPVKRLWGWLMKNGKKDAIRDRGNHA